MRPTALLILVTAALASSAPAQGLKPGVKAPTFAGTDLDGKKHTLKTLTVSGPVILFFINADCGASPMYMPHYQALIAPYKGKANFIGVIDEAKANATKWKADYKPTYPLILDPEMKIIGAYKANASPWAVMIDKNGKVTKTWAGYSKSILTDLNAALAKQAKVRPAKIDVSTAPSVPSYG